MVLQRERNKGGWSERERERGEEQMKRRAAEAKKESG